MRLKKVCILSLALAILATVIPFNSSAASLESDYKTFDSTTPLAAKYFYTAAEFEKVRQADAAMLQEKQLNAISTQNNKQIIMMGGPEYIKTWDHYEASNAYLDRTHYKLGTCQFVNNSSGPITGTYTQSYSVQLSASLNYTVSSHADATAAVISCGQSVSTSVTLSASVSAGTTIATGATVQPRCSVMFTAYMGGVCVDGTAVYKYTNRETHEYTYIREAAGNNWIISPTDLTVVAS